MVTTRTTFFISRYPLSIVNNLHRLTVALMIGMFLNPGSKKLEKEQLFFIDQIKCTGFFLMIKARQGGFYNRSGADRGLQNTLFLQRKWMNKISVNNFPPAFHRMPARIDRLGSAGVPPSPPGRNRSSCNAILQANSFYRLHFFRGYL